MRVRPWTISFANQGIVIGRDHVPLIGCRIDPNAEAAGGMKIGNSSRRGRECARMLRVDAAFDRGSKDSDIILRDRERRAGRNLDLLIDDVDSGDHFGDRMLDLDPCIHLNEEELPVLVQELDRSSADVAQLSHRLGDNSADALALFRVQSRGGAFLPNFLVAALKGAVAVAEVDGATVRVAEHLNFDMARLGEIFLQVDGIIAERGPRFDLGGA